MHSQKSHLPRCQHPDCNHNVRANEWVSIIGQLKNMFDTVYESDDAVNKVSALNALPERERVMCKQGAQSLINSFKRHLSRLAGANAAAVPVPSDAVVSPIAELRRKGSRPSTPTSSSPSLATSPVPSTASSQTSSPASSASTPSPRSVMPLRTKPSSPATGAGMQIVYSAATASASGGSMHLAPRTLPGAPSPAQTREAMAQANVLFTKSSTITTVKTGMRTAAAAAGVPHTWEPVESVSLPSDMLTEIHASPHPDRLLQVVCAPNIAAFVHAILQTFRTPMEYDILAYVNLCSDRERELAEKRYQRMVLAAASRSSSSSASTFWTPTAVAVDAAGASTAQRGYHPDDLVHIRSDGVMGRPPASAHMLLPSIDREVESDQPLPLLAVPALSTSDGRGVDDFSM